MNDLTYTLPSDWYWNKEVYLKEREKIFSKQWMLVGQIENLQNVGDYITDIIADYPVLVIKNEEGVLKAFHNVCRHRASQIKLDSKGKCNNLVCPYHGWKYDLDGKLISNANFKGNMDLKLFSLYEFKVEQWRDLVFINMNPEASPLSEVIYPVEKDIERNFSDNMEFYKELHFKVKCNWKTYIDNYQEGYHIPLIHPQLSKDLEWQEYKVINEGNCSIHRVNARGGSNQQGSFGWMFPNFSYNTYGRGSSYMRVNPIGAGEIRLSYFLYKDMNLSSEEFEKEALEYQHLISQEDQDMVPFIQKNLEAGIYHAGPLSHHWENGLIHFHSLIRSSIS